METTDLDRGARNPLSPVIGAVATGLALGVSELLSGLFRTFPSLISGLATWVIDTVPRPVKEWAISTFGTADKTVLAVSIVVVALGIGAAVGTRRLAPLLYWGFGLVAALAAMRSPLVGPIGSLLSGLISAGAGVAALRWLSQSGAGAAIDPRRREVLKGLAGFGALAVLFAAVGRSMAERARRVIAARDEVVLPAAVELVEPPGPGASLGVDGLTPIVTSNVDFFRIDTVPFSVPSVDLSTWSLSVSGMVGRTLEFSYPELLEFEMLERYVTLSCVSNPVGGELIGNARWLGFPLSRLLDIAGVDPSAEQVAARSVDGWGAGFPIGAVYDGRECLVAVGMNGEPLPFEHGFPVRLVVEGLYGYVSATKWLSSIELVRWNDYDGYWVPRGWSKEAPIKTQSRIDTPRNGRTLQSGTVSVAGVAWAPGRGVNMVEVAVDGDPWHQATISRPLSDATWVQWVWDWDGVPGAHLIEVRATDGDGITQTSDIRPPAPDGATGYHGINVTVE